jgi:hypothetical protein
MQGGSQHECVAEAERGVQRDEEYTVAATTTHNALTHKTQSDE